MKKSSICVILAIAVAISLCLPFSGALDYPSSADWRVPLSQDMPLPAYALPEDGRLDVTSGQFGTLTSYAAFAAADLGKDKKITWRAIDAKVTGLDGKMDVSVLAQKPGVLAFAAGDAAASATNSSIDSDKIFYYVIPALGTKLKIEKPSYKIDGTGSVAVIASLPANLEITRAEDSDGWRDFDGAIPVLSYKADYWVRLKSDETKNNSPLYKFSVPAVPAPPSVKVDVKKGQVNVKKGMRVAVQNSSGTGYRDLTDGSLKAFVIGETYEFTDPSGTTVKIKITPATVFTVLSLPTSTKPASTPARLDLADYNDGIAASANDFALRTKDITTVGGAPYEIYDENKGKWGKLKTLKFDKIPSDGIRIRQAGTDTRFPGLPAKLTLSETGVITVTPEV